jgi:glycosyltransferase involved in cell wall biosynthesis
MVASLPVTRAVAFPAVAPTVTVVVCTYTEHRWETLVTALASLRTQSCPPDQYVVVVDHNDLLLARAHATFGRDVEVISNEDKRGLAGARNTGVRWATGDVVAFLDDDAEAEPGWLATMIEHYSNRNVVGVGGLAEASWPEGGRPRWFPPEFDWVVGCSYRGLPDVVAPVRNPIGASMSLRRSLFDEVGGFDTAIGRVGTTPLGCEETEFAVRARQQIEGIEFLHVPGAVVHHRVAPERARLRYFLRRCYSEGLSKAAVARRTGADAALSSERRYAAVTLPRAVAAEFANAIRGDPMGLARAVMITVGLLVTTFGYVAPFVAFRRRPRAR